MKVRNGFVSNSSSASFLINFKSGNSLNQLIEMMRLSDDYLYDNWTNKKVSDSEDFYFEGVILNEIEENKYQLKVSTVMFNDWTDIYSWKFIRALSEDRLINCKLINIVQTEKEYETEHEIVEFNPNSWEYDDKKTKKTKKIQFEIDMGYLDYLSYVTNLNEEETRTVAKHRLNK